MWVTEPVWTLQKMMRELKGRSARLRYKAGEGASEDDVWATAVLRNSKYDAWDLKERNITGSCRKSNNDFLDDKSLYRLWLSSHRTDCGCQVTVPNLVVQSLYRLWLSSHSTEFSCPVTVPTVVVKSLYRIWLSSHCTDCGCQVTVPTVVVKSLYRLWFPCSNY